MEGVPIKIVGRATLSSLITSQILGITYRSFCQKNMKIIQKRLLWIAWGKQAKGIERCCILGS